MKIIMDSTVLDLSRQIADCLERHFPKTSIYVVNDVEGEDHIYSKDETGRSMFDILISSGRKFAFLWYYIHPQKGMTMVDEMKNITLANDRDFVVKFPNVPVKKAGWPSILRYGKKIAGASLERFIIKAGNPQLNEEIFSQENLNTYRSHDWHKVRGAFGKILKKSEEMIPQRLGKNINKLKNIRGICLYAGCAFDYAYPHLGFGMRDIDVQVFFSPDWYTNTRCAFTRHCDIKEFGEPEYFGGKTRWLDLMWNSFHTETGNFKNDVVTYMNEMRYKSDRWATISQRPIIDLKTKKIIYEPIWLKKIEKEITK